RREDTRRKAPIRCSPRPVPDSWPRSLPVPGRAVHRRAIARSMSAGAKFLDAMLRAGYQGKRPPAVMKDPVHRSVRPFPRMVFGKLLRCVLPLAAMAELSARQWHFEGIAEPVEADYVAMGNGFVVLRGGNGTSFEVPLGAFGKV